VGEERRYYSGEEDWVWEPCVKVGFDGSFVAES
jgi:hypothetical protein